MVAAAAALEAALKDVADVDPVFMPTPEKKAALVALDRALARLEELRLRVLAAADDVALDEGARDVAAWLAHRDRRDRGGNTPGPPAGPGAGQPLAPDGAGVARGEANRAQAEVIVAALETLPDDLHPELLAQAEERLVTEAGGSGHGSCGSWVAGSWTWSPPRWPRTPNGGRWSAKRPTRRRSPR